MLEEDHPPGPVVDLHIYTNGATHMVDGKQYLIDSLNGLYIYNLYQREPVGLFAFYHSQDNKSRSKKPNYFATASLLSKLFTDSIPYTSKSLIRAISRNHESVANFASDLAVLCLREVENRVSQTPNNLSDDELENYHSTNAILREIGQDLAEVPGLLSAKSVPAESVEAKSATKILTSIRSSLAHWIANNKHETTDVLMRTPVLSAIVYGLSFVGLPPTTAMLAAITMYPPESTKSYLKDIAKNLKA